MKRIMASLATSVAFAACGVESIDPGGTIGSKGGKSENEAPAPVSVEKTLDLSKCGFDLTKPTALIASNRFAMDPIKKTIETSILGGLFPTKTDVTYSGSLVMEGSLNGVVLSQSASVAPVVNKQEVTDFLNSAKLSGDAKLVDSASRAKIGESFSDWAGLFCTFQPAKRIERNGDTHVAIEFSQPIPFGVLAVAGSERIKTEVGTKRTWNKVVAKVAESTDGALIVGTSYTGTITSSTVAPTGIAGLTADVAVKITYDFGADKTSLLGLPQSIIWYFDTAGRTIKGAQVDVGGTVLTFK